MGVGPAEFGGADDLAGRRLHQRRPGKEDRALALRPEATHDHRLVAHRRHVGAAGGAETHDAGDLGDALRAHPRLVVEDAAEMIAIGKHLGLVRQVGAAAIHQIDAGQAVLLGDLLRAQVLLHRHREIGAALHRRVVGDDHHLAAAHPADAGDDPGARRLAVVEPPGRQLAELQERRAGIEQALHPIARQQFPTRDMAIARGGRPAQAGDADSLAQRRGKCAIDLRVAGERLAAGIDRAGQARHRGVAPPMSSRPIRKRRISLVPAPMS